MPVKVHFGRLPPEPGYNRPDPCTPNTGDQSVSLAGLLTFGCCLCVYIALAAATPLVEGSISAYRKSPYKI